MDPEDPGTNNSQAALGCGTTFEYVVLVTACTILLLAVTGTTVYWTMAYRGGYDSNWLPWPPQTPKQLLSVGVFTYKHPQNFTASGGLDGDISTTTTSTVATTIEQQQSAQINSSSSNILIEDRRFNLHPTLMTIGFVTLTGFCKYKTIHYNNKYLHYTRLFTNIRFSAYPLVNYGIQTVFN